MRLSCLHLRVSSAGKTPRSHSALCWRRVRYYSALPPRVYTVYTARSYMGARLLRLALLILALLRAGAFVLPVYTASYTPAQRSWLHAARPPRHAAVLAARGRGPPTRRITRDAENRPTSDRRRGRGRGRGAGRRGRGARRKAAPSPTAKPVVGQLVSVLQKQHYHTGERTNGTVAAVLTRAAEHSRGYKVRLSSNIVGRCVELLGDAPAQPAERESGRGAIEWPDPPLPPY